MKLYVFAMTVAATFSCVFFAGSFFSEKAPSSPKATETKGKEDPLKDEIRVVSVANTPEPESVLLAIQYPKEGAEISGNPVWMQVRVNGYSLGSDSDFDRSYEVVDSPMGQTLHVVIDNQPYFAINGPSVQPFNESGYYYDQNYRFRLPAELSRGLHFVRVFPARSFGEALKGDKRFQASYFFIGSRSDNAAIDMLSDPYLTYNEPGDQVHYQEGKPILLDFYVTNCELSPDGYKVRLSIDRQIQRMLTSWQPYYLYGLAKGSHTIRLELIGPDSKLVAGPFNDNSREIVVINK